AAARSPGERRTVRSGSGSSQGASAADLLRAMQPEPIGHSRTPASASIRVHRLHQPVKCRLGASCFPSYYCMKRGRLPGISLACWKPNSGSELWTKNMTSDSALRECGALRFPRAIADEHVRSWIPALKMTLPHWRGRAAAWAIKRTRKENQYLLRRSATLPKSFETVGRSVSLGDFSLMSSTM